METSLVISILINIFLSGSLITLTIHEMKTTKDEIRFLNTIEEFTRLIRDLNKAELKEDSNEPRQSDRT